VKLVSEKIDVMDLIINVLKEHEKVLDGLSRQLHINIKNLEKVIYNAKRINATEKTAKPAKAECPLSGIAAVLMSLPEGFTFEVSREGRTVHVKITETAESGSEP